MELNIFLPILTAPGKKERAKTQTDSFDNTSRKKTDMSTIDQLQLNIISQKLNSRPRKKLGFKNPLQVFMATFQNLNTVALGS